MDTTTDLTPSIAQQAAEPIAVTADGQSTTGRGIDDLIKANNYLAATAAMKLRRRGLLFTKLLPPGALGDGPCGGRGCGFGGE